MTTPTTLEARAEAEREREREREREKVRRKDGRTDGASCSISVSSFVPLLPLLTLGGLAFAVSLLLLTLPSYSFSLSLSPASSSAQFCFLVSAAASRVDERRRRKKPMRSGNISQRGGTKRRWRRWERRNEGRKSARRGWLMPLCIPRLFSNLQRRGEKENPSSSGSCTVHIRCIAVRRDIIGGGNVTVFPLFSALSPVRVYYLPRFHGMEKSSRFSIKRKGEQTPQLVYYSSSSGYIA